MACRDLLRRSDVALDAIEAARRDQIQYTRPLAAFDPGVRYRLLRFPVPAGWSRFNPSIAADGDGFLATVRSANYTRSPAGFIVTSDPPVIRSLHYLVDVAPDLTVRSARLILDETDPAERFAGPFLGYEDCRLVRWGGTWFAIATTRERNPAGRAQMVLLGLEGDRIRTVRSLSVPESTRDEKNWMPIAWDGAPALVYSCRPTRIIAIDPETGRTEAGPEWPGSRPLSWLRGSSQGVPFDGGVLFVVHESVQLSEVPFVWRYPHRFLWMDASLQVQRVSDQFFFLAPGVEFCAGLAHRGRDLLVSFGSEDRDAWIALVSADAVRQMLAPVDADADGVAEFPATIGR